MLGIADGCEHIAGNDLAAWYVLGCHDNIHQLIRERGGRLLPAQGIPALSREQQVSKYRCGDDDEQDIDDNSSSSFFHSGHQTLLD